MFKKQVARHHMRRHNEISDKRKKLNRKRPNKKTENKNEQEPH